MTERQPLYILFTMNCDPPITRTITEGPKSWEQSGRAIEGFCNRVLRAGYLPTLFLSNDCAEEHAPLLEEVARRGTELALYLHPPHIGDGRFKNSLGQYSAEDQRAMIDFAAERFADSLGVRPRSFRGGRFSASDATFKQLAELGFRQCSLSEPGRDVPAHHATWRDADPYPHYASATDRLRPGELPLLEIPVTTDPTELVTRGIPFALNIETGNLAALHQPTIERQLELMERDGVVFRALCIYTTNRIDYYAPDDKHGATVEDLIDYFESLRERFEVTPVTLAGAHEHYRRRAGTLSAKE